MNPDYNPYGVLSNLGPGQTPRYIDIGQYSNRYGRICQHNGRLSYSQASQMVENPHYPEPRAYRNRQMANMQDQMLYDGDGGAYAWRLSMMNDAEMRREISRYS